MEFETTNNHASSEHHPLELGQNIAQLQNRFQHHLRFTLVKDQYSAKNEDLYNALAFCVRDLLVEGWFETQKAYYANDGKRVYYLSMEFLMGRTLGNSLINLGIMNQWKSALAGLNIDINDLLEMEWDAGLGNGGLGRLAACFLDSMATMQLPAFGYGIRYEYGMFNQRIVNGAQVESPDSWLRYNTPWEFIRQDHLHKIQFQGRVEEIYDAKGAKGYQWVETHDVMALAYDVPIPGYDKKNVNTLRLWSAKSTREFELASFNQGNYIGAVESKMRSENISKVLYPADHIAEGKELRLRQEYFLSAATVRDIFLRFEKKNKDYSLLPEKVAIQLNDTHPTLAIPEFMRILVDEKHIPWEKAWEISRNVFAYTNHTVMSEALEKWPTALMNFILPRHLQIIYKINFEFLKAVEARFPGDMERLKRMSIISEDSVKQVRMANLAIVGSFSVNGVSALHSDILKTDLFLDFYEMYPSKFNNKTNGITQRRWLKFANPELGDLITSKIGNSWVTNLNELQKLKIFSQDAKFVNEWMRVKRTNKQALADHILKNYQLSVSVDALFDCQSKRIHEYKRQLLSLLHVITRYNRLKKNPKQLMAPRVVLFSGKAAPSYYMAKLIIQLIGRVSEIVNNDSQTNEKLKVLFLSNYNVSLAELLIPAADLSEQISTAGTEASGTGNMKYALNGALTIGTLDGANIEMMEEIGRENMFIFGLTSDDVNKLRYAGYRPYDYYAGNPELKQAIDMISNGSFSNGDSEMFRPIVESLLGHDQYMLLADYKSYIETQDRVDHVYLDQRSWAEKSIYNSAAMGKFSSDRTIAEYADEIWKIKPVPTASLNNSEQSDRAS